MSSMDIHHAARQHGIYMCFKVILRPQSQRARYGGSDHGLCAGEHPEQMGVGGEVSHPYYAVAENPRSYGFLIVIKLIDCWRLDPCVSAVQNINGSPYGAKLMLGV